jgi:hypothetical protein
MVPVGVSTRPQKAIAAIDRAKSVAILVVLLGSLTACSSYHPRSTAPTPFPRPVTLERRGSVLGDFMVTYPAAWTIAEHRNGQVALLRPATGKGRLRIIAMADHEPPATLSRAYAAAVCKRALNSLGLRASIAAIRAVSADQLMVFSAGPAGRTAVTEIVHVFRSGQVVVAFFRAPALDVHFGTAKRIMKSLRPKLATP